MSSRKINRALPLQISRTDAVRDALREAILAGELPAGQRLNLDEIASDFGVSRMPVRDAVRQLEAEGLVRVFPYRGVEVSTLSAEEIEELFALRRVLEQQAAERAVPRLNDEELAEMRRILQRLDRLKGRGAEWMELNAAFHHILNEASGWPRLIEMIDVLRTNVDRYVRSYLTIQGRELPQKQHWELLHACEARDVAAACMVIEKHLSGTAEALAHAIAQQQRAPALPKPRRAARRVTG